MTRRSHASSSRTLLGLAGLVNLGVIVLGATAIIAAPASVPTGNGTTVASTAPAAHGSEQPRLLKWSGLTWYVYPNCDDCGPSLTPTTNASDAVYVDDRGYLHLKVTKVAGKWRGVELRALTRPTYGTYRWIVDTATADLDRWAVLSMFLYRPGAKKFTSEIDIENSRFPRYLKAPNNAQFAVQPYRAPHHAHPYHVKPSYKPLFQEFTWYPPARGKGTVKFQTRVGTTPHAPLLTRWAYHGASSPTDQNMYLYITLWLNHGKAPRHGTHSATLRSLTVSPIR